MEPITSFTGQYAFLTNFYPSPIRADDGEYPTVEHYFQSRKTDDPAEREMVRTAPTPAAAKKAGRKVTLRSDWESAKDGVMAMALALKFSDSSLAAQLVATGDAELVEGNSWNDRYWGQCPVGNGQNRLGELLMDLRSQLS